MLVVACGSPRAPTQPAPTPPAPAVPDAAIAVAPDAVDVAACSARVAVMKQRFDAASQHWIAALSFATAHDFPTGIPDLELAPPPITVAIVKGRGTPCKWATEVSGEGGPPVRATGTQRVKRALAEAKRRLPKGARIGLQISQDVEPLSIMPLVSELAKLGTLQLRLVVKGARFPVPGSDATKWAQDRMAEGGVPHRAVIADTFTCPAMKAAWDKIDPADVMIDKKFDLIAEEVPRATAECKCTGVDVDAIEYLALDFMVGGVHSLSEGYAELRVDPKSATVLRAGTDDELGDALAAIPREQRVKGVKLELFNGRVAGFEPQHCN